MKRVVGYLVIGALGVMLVPGAASAQSCGDLLIVLDRSGSMHTCLVDGKTKESMANAAIKAAIAKYPTLPMGLFVFPDTIASCGVNCTVGKTVVDINAAGGMMVSSYIDTMPMSCGGTPTGDSMTVVKDYAGWLPGKQHYVMIITDGQPTCTDGFKDMAKTMPCDGMGFTTQECAYPTKVWDAIKALFDKGIHTFVVGFAGMGSGSGCGTGGMPFNPATLNMMADLGGEANAGATHFYSATDAKSIADALDRIGDKVMSGTVGGCRPGSGDGGTGSGDGGGGTGGSAGSGGASGAGGMGGAGGQGTDDGGNPGTTPRAHPACDCDLGGAAGGGPAAGLLAMALLGSLRRSRRR